MSQRNKFRQEYLLRDAIGNIVGVATDVALDVLLAGAKVSSGATIGGSSAAWVEVYHPGRLNINVAVRVQDGTDPSIVGTSSLIVEDRELTGAGVWRLYLRNSTGAAVTVDANDRLVVWGPGSGFLGRPTLYADDTSALTLSNPLNANLTTGVAEFFCEETDVDIRITKRTDTNYTYGYITDIHIGGRRQFVNPQDWGAQGDGVTDAWAGLQNAIEYSEDSRDRRTVIHITGGDYPISEPLIITQDDVEIWMDSGTIIRPGAGWAGSELFQVYGNNVVFRGGTVDADGSVSFGIRPYGDGLRLDDVAAINALGSNLYCSEVDNLRVIDGIYSGSATYGIGLYGVKDAQIRGSRITDNEGTGVFVTYTAGQNTDDISIMNCYIDGAGATNPTDGFTIVGNPADNSRVNGVLIANNRISNVGDLGINAKDSTAVRIVDNKLRNIGGVNSGGLDNNHGIRIDGCANSQVRGNVGDVVNGNGIRVIGDASRCSLVDNNFSNCQQEGIYVDAATDTKVIGNDMQGNALNASATYEYLFTANSERSIIIGNTIGPNGIDIAAGATYEIGHNVEL